jgi:hypothetical protein
MSNYPWGVTGHEYEISGPDYEQEAGQCPSCGKESLVEFGYQKRSWNNCNECGYHSDIEPPERDPDRARDERIEREYEVTP